MASAAFLSVSLQVQVGAGVLWGCWEWAESGIRDAGGGTAAW